MEAPHEIIFHITGNSIFLTFSSPPSVGTMVMASEANPTKSPPFCAAEQRSEYSRFVDVVAGRVITKVWKCKFKHEKKARLHLIPALSLYTCVTEGGYPKLDPLLSGWESTPLMSTLNSPCPSTSRSPSKVHSKDLRRISKTGGQFN